MSSEHHLCKKFGDMLTKLEDQTFLFICRQVSGHHSPNNVLASIPRIVFTADQSLPQLVNPVLVAMDGLPCEGVHLLRNETKKCAVCVAEDLLSYQPDTLQPASSPNEATRDPAFSR